MYVIVGKNKYEDLFYLIYSKEGVLIWTLDLNQAHIFKQKPELNVHEGKVKVFVNGHFPRIESFTNTYKDICVYKISLVKEGLAGWSGNNPN